MKKILTVAVTFCATSAFSFSLFGERVTTLDIIKKKEERIRISTYKIEKSPAPTVMVLHGCGGVDQHHRDWAKQLNDWGFNAVVVDSFTSRGQKNICAAGFSISPTQRAVDVHLTAKWIREQTWSTEKVGMIGFSHGGWTVLHASTKEDAEREIGASYVTSGVALYPPCTPTLLFFQKNIPLQMHVGLSDDWTPASPCRDIAKKWDLDKNYFEYEGAYHGYDRIGTDTTVTGAWGDTVKQRTVRYDQQANEMTRQRTKEFFDNTLR